MVRTKADLGLSAFAEEDIYKHAVLGEVKNVDTKVIQIVDNLPVFATEVLGSSTANESNQKIPVVYSLGIIMTKPESRNRTWQTT